MKHVIGPMAGLLLAFCVSGCAGLAVDPVALAQAVKVLNEGCERTLDLDLDKTRPGEGSLKVTRTCAQAPAAETTEAPKP